MAAITTSTQEESFACSSSRPPRNYDVFLSFRGEDTRNNFTDYLFAALNRRGFHTFRDDNKLERGEDIGSELLKAIEQSKISVVVFSRNYAASRWCLDELVKIMECRNSFQQMVVPVFYDVDPSDVRAQRGNFAEAFARHEERYKGDEMEDKVKRWRDALTKAADLSGWDLQNMANWSEANFVEKIVEDISKKLNLPYLNVANYPVGIESRVQHVNKLLRLRPDDVRIIGIWGIGGIGKTTIAKAVFNLIHLKFEGSSILLNVGEISKQPNGLVVLQQRLLSDILMNENQNIRNFDQGIEVIKQRLWCGRRVLVVLDDVDNIDQLKALAIRREWFHSGSRIIVTTRDKFLLNFLEVDEVYVPELLTYDESLQLFNWHAFRKYHPIEDYVELSREVVGYAGGLPLVLEVLGSFFKGTSVLEWKSALESLKAIPHDDIQSKLRISYDSLNDQEMELFLNIAVFFVGMDKNYTIEILKGCGLLFPEITLGVLSRRCLVRIDGDWLMMHDIIRDMGRYITRSEYPKEPGKRSRLWFHEDVIDVLTNHTGTKAVEGLVLNLPTSNDVQVNAKEFAKMTELRLLELNYVHLRGSYEHLSKKLSWLCWFGFPLKFIPSNLFMEKVVAIDMRYSNLKQIWKGMKILNNLKFLNLSHSYNLIETPDFSGLTSLQMLLLNNCTRLVEVHHSIKCLDKLVVLDLKNCKNLRKLPQGVWKLTSLQNLSLCDCSKLEKFPVSEVSPSKSWFSHILSLASLLRNPYSIGLSQASAQGLISLRKLDLEYCNLSNVPDELGSFISLEILKLTGNNFCTLPDSIIHLSQLRFLCISQCTSLESLPKLPANLKAVVARDCPLLERISITSNLPHANRCTSFERKSNESYLLVPQFSTFFGCNRKANNNLASNFRKSHLQNQGLSALYDLNILLPNDEVLDYFKCHSVGSDLSIVMSLLPDRKFQGWILCIVYAVQRDERVTESDLHFNLPFFYNVKNKTKGLERHYEPAFDDYPEILKDHMWLHYVPQPYLELLMEGGDEVEYSVSVVNPLFVVKKCGVDLIYDNKDYISNDLSGIRRLRSYVPRRDVIIDEGVSADQAVADNKKSTLPASLVEEIKGCTLNLKPSSLLQGRESTTTTTSAADARVTSRKSKHNDDNKSGSHKRNFWEEIPRRQRSSIVRQGRH